MNEPKFDLSLTPEQEAYIGLVLILLACLFGVPLIAWAWIHWMSWLFPGVWK